MDPISHQNFVDDTMLMGQLTIHDAQALKQVLEDIQVALGTMVNHAKS